MKNEIMLSDSELKEFSMSLKDEIKKIRNALSQLETDVAVLQTGDAHGAYWSGPSAYRYIKNCISQMDHDRNLLKELEKCSQYVDSLVK